MKVLNVICPKKATMKSTKKEHYLNKQNAQMNVMFVKYMMCYISFEILKVKSEMCTCFY